MQPLTGIGLHHPAAAAALGKRLGGGQVSCGRLVERSVLQISKQEMESPFSEEFVAVLLASPSHRPPLSVPSTNRESNVP